MIRPILRYGADTLHRAAARVAEVTPDIQRLIDDMIKTMYAAPGVGRAGRGAIRGRRPLDVVKPR